MRAGKLRHRIQIQRAVDSQDNGYNEPITEWMLFAEVSAKITPLSNRELIMAKQIELETDTMINIRYLPDVSPKMRVVFGDRIFNILGIVNVEERNRELNLLCSEIKE